MKDTGTRLDSGGDASLFGDASAFIAAAHELKAPLALVRQLSIYLEDGDTDPVESAKLLRQITLTSERALRLTSDLTRARRLDQMSFALEPINPQVLCEDVAHELTPLFSAYGKTLRVIRRSKSVLAVGNSDLLRRILLNFADNALHYADGTGVVELKTQLIGDQARVGVRDYGPHIEADMWRSLKHRLGKGPQPVHNRPTSSGLGLYIADQFAECMQGAIGATRHRDGASFYVDLGVSRQLSLLV